MNEKQAVDEIIEGETVPRPTDAELAAAIMAALDEVKRLQELNQRVVAFNVDLQGRIDRMIELAKDDAASITRRVYDAMERMTTGGTHRDKDEQQLTAIGHLLRLMRDAEYLPVRLREAAGGAKRPRKADIDEIPF